MCFLMSGSNVPSRPEALMRKSVLIVLLVGPAGLQAQNAAPIFIGQNLTMRPAAIDALGRTVAFASAITPEGASTSVPDLYTAAADGSGLRRLTNLPSDAFQPRGVSAVSLAPSGARAAFTTAGPTASPPPPNSAAVEEVHILELATGAD